MDFTPLHLVAERPPPDRSAAAITLRARRASRAAELDRLRLAAVAPPKPMRAQAVYDVESRRRAWSLQAARAGWRSLACVVLGRC